MRLSALFAFASLAVVVFAASACAADFTQCASGTACASCNGNGSLQLDCAGGGCSVSCDGNGSCAIADCPTCTCHEGLLGGSCGHI